MVDLGLSLEGKQLQRIPVGATESQKTSIINDMIDKINSNSLDVVRTGTTTLQYGTVDDFGILTLDYTMKTIPHNLGYKPRAYLWLNGARIKFKPGILGAEQIIEDVDTPLPCPLNGPAMAIFGSGGGGAPDTNLIGAPFWDWLWFFVDEKNLYIIYMPNIYYPYLDLPKDASLYRVQISYELHKRPTIA